MKIKVDIGKNGKVKIPKESSLGEIIALVEEHAGTKVSLDNIKQDGNFAIYKTGETKVVEIDDKEIFAKIKTLVKKEAGIKTNNFSMEFIFKGK